MARIPPRIYQALEMAYHYGEPVALPYETAYNLFRHRYADIVEERINKRYTKQKSNIYAVIIVLTKKGKQAYEELNGNGE